MGSRAHFPSVIVFILCICLPTILAQNETSTTALAGSDQGLHICFGTGGICLADDDIVKECDLQGEAHDDNVGDACICTSGGAAIKDACEDCRLAYGLASSRFTLPIEKCSSLGLDVAPIPADILQQQSSRNASLATAPITGGEAPTLAITFKPTPAGPIPTDDVDETGAGPLETGSSGASRLTFAAWQAQLALGIGMYFWL